MKPLSLVTALLLANLLPGADWTDYRGPKRDGTSEEKNLPSSWSLAGENLAWKAPFGGRSAAVIHGNKLYVFTTKGEGASLQERVVCLNADTGQMLWDYPMNVYQSDVPPHRAAWSSPAVDPETGNVYAFGVGGLLVALDSSGKLLWERSMVEEQGLVTTHGGRTASPVVYQNLVIVSGVSTGWGEHARPAHRYFALDKKTGTFVWISAPGGRPFDTTYAPPIIAEVNKTKLLIAGGGDGAVHALKVLTGELVWTYEMAKRGVNTGVLVYNNTAIVSHSEENLDSNEMGLLAAVDASQTGKLGPANVKWAIKGFQGGYSSPIMDGDRVFQIDNGSNLYAFDFHSGKKLWEQHLGTVQKASPVLADGKIYVGTESGKFYILRPHQDKAEILSEVELGDVPGKEQVLASTSVARGRIYVVSTEHIYAIGKKGKGVEPAAYKPEPAPSLPANTKAAHLQVVPAEIVVSPGQSIRYMVRAYDEFGQFIREVDTKDVQFTLAGLKGNLAGGTYTAPAGGEPQAGVVKVSALGLSGSARVRVVPPLPWDLTFNDMAPGTVPEHWTNTRGKFVVREVDGEKVLVKLADNAFTKRARAYMGSDEFSNYTVQVDVRATERRRQMGDAGVVAQRYQLALFGNHQRLELMAWQPETKRTVSKDYAWQKDTWYRMKLRVENLSDGRVRVQGKVWPVAEAEPAAWTIETVDPIGNRKGAPGLYADAPFEIFFDNLKVTPDEPVQSAASANSAAEGAQKEGNE